MGKLRRLAGVSSTWMIAALSVSATAAAAPMGSQTQTATDLGNGVSKTLNFNQFDPALGSLQGVQVQLDGSITGTARFQSFEIGGPASVSASFGGTISVSAPDESSITAAQPSAAVSGAISASDTRTTIATTTPVPPAASILGAFTGTGSVGLPVSAAIRSFASGPLNVNA